MKSNEKRLKSWVHWKKLSIERGDYDKVPTIKEDELLFAEDIKGLLLEVERLRSSEGAPGATKGSDG